MTSLDVRESPSGRVTGWNPTFDLLRAWTSFSRLVICRNTSNTLVYVIVLEKRDHLAVKLFFQYKQIKVDTQQGFVHNSECLNNS